MRRFIIIVAVVIVLALVAIPVVIALSGARPNTAAAQTTGGTTGSRSSVQRATVDKGNIQLTVSATGSIVAKQQSNLSFTTPGRVTQIMVVEGQKVDAGQVLATVDDATAQANLQQATASVGAAQAALDKLLEPVSQTNLANAQAVVKSAEGAYSAAASGTNAAVIKANQLTVQQADAAAQAAEQNRMAAGRFGVDDPKYQQALAQVGVASFTSETARLKLQQSQRGQMLNQAMANVAVAQAKLAQVEAGPTQEQINSAQASVASAQVASDQAQHALDKTKLTAPYAGIVTSVGIKQNEMSSGTAMVLTDLSELAVDINVDEADIGQILVGQHVNLTVDALPGTALTGTIQRIKQLADETASVITYTVHIKLDPTDAAIKAEMTANAVFLIREVDNVLRVPNQFVRTNPTTKQTTVQVVNPDNSLTEVPVKVGLQSSDYTEIVQGLSEGETVALSLAAPTPAGG